MKRETKLAVAFVAATVIVVVLFVALPRGPETDPDAERRTRPVPAQPTAGEESVATRVAVTPVAIKSVADIDNTAEAFGWRFEFPWPPLVAAEPTSAGIRFTSQSGNGIFARLMLKAVDWDQQFLDADAGAREWLKGLEAQSAYAFYAAVLGATEDQQAVYTAQNQSARLQLALAIKDALCPRGVSAIRSFELGGLRGFQVGDASSRRVSVLVLPRAGKAVELDFYTRGSGRFTQSEVEQVIGSLQAAMTTRDAGRR